MCHLALQPLVKLGLQLSKVFSAMILHIIYISDIYGGNTSFFTLSQTQRWILQHHVTRTHCSRILRRGLRKVTGHLLDTRTNDFNK